jgi:hypothetical protein
VILGKPNRWLDPELCLAVGMINMHMHAWFLAGEKEEPITAFAK